MLDVEQWADLRREHFVQGVGIKELARRYGIDRNTVRRALRSPDPPRYQRPAVVSKLEPFKDEIHRLLKDDPKLSGVRVRELIEPLGFDVRPRGGRRAPAGPHDRLARRATAAR